VIPAGQGKIYLNPLGLIPDPLEKSSHSFSVIFLDYLFIAEHIKKAYSFL